MDATEGTGGPGVLLDERYQLGEVLGTGGMAQVHRGRDVVLERDVAVKVLRDHVGGRDRERFVGEARMLAGLSHPHLVTVLDAGTTAERPYLVMELVEGSTLADAVRSGPLPPHEVAALGEQVALALAYAHGRDVVHRDVKPGNVLLARDGGAKLADFGIAKLLGETVRHTQTGTTIGTAAYLSPEQVQGQAVDGATDVYALGLVLLEALTGARAYPGTPTEAALARLHRAPEVPTSLSTAWRDLLTRMTDLDPERRPTAAEVATVLGGLTHGDASAVTEPLTVAADPTATRALPAPVAGRKPSRLPGARLALALAGLLLLVLLVAAALASRGPDAASDEIPAETPRELRGPLRDLHDAVNGG